MIYTSFNVKYRAMVSCSTLGGWLGCALISDFLHQYICKDTFFVQRFFHTYTTMIKVFMGRRRHLHCSYCIPFACSFFTCICFDASILLCHGFVDVNSFLCNLDNNIFFLWSTRMPRQWGTRPILRPRSRNTMCRPKHTGGCR